MSKIIYKHRKTNDLVVKKDDYFHFFDGDCISQQNKLPLLMVADSDDWELITNDGRDSFELLLDTNNEIYFKSIITGQEYRIGDEITIKKYVSFGDGKRNFKIGRWYIGAGPVERNIFNYIYAHTECDDRSTHLTNVIVKTKK
jgi:hypothetical protein